MMSVQRKPISSSFLSLFQEFKEKYLVEEEPSYTDAELQSQFVAKFGGTPEELKVACQRYLERQLPTISTSDFRDLMNQIELDQLSHLEP